ncbi:MAG: cobalt-precorrin 5A hydrolase [Veillonellaceae bacterium]|nr:cobalt-precorrin 5A hydrolase [Veillonellaceae bacterium]
MSRCAVISVTERGARLGARVAAGLDTEVTLYEREGRGSGKPAVYFRSTPALTKEIFGEYDVLLYIMATGIVVRSIAPCVQDKTRDPAVIVMDEGGKHAISLLSGHLGGANEWTQVIAELAGAVPVITTATDVQGRPAPDVLARRIGARVTPVAKLKPVNAAVAHGEEVRYYVDERMPLAEAIRAAAAELGIVCRPTAELAAPQTQAATVVISDRCDLSAPEPAVYLRPPTLVLGMGCRRGTEEALLANAVREACAAVGRSPLAVAHIVSVDVKADEEGLLALAETYRRPITFYPRQELAEVIRRYGLEESEFVKKTIGVGNICESTVILTTKNPQLILGKTKYRSATVALGEATSLSSVSARVMKKR